MSSYIIDNQSQTLVDAINEQLDYAGNAHIAVGYCYLFELRAIADKLAAKDENGDYIIKKVRLLIGNYSDHNTIEELARSYRLKSIIGKELEAQQHPGQAAGKRFERDARTHTEQIMSGLDQTYSIPSSSPGDDSDRSSGSPVIHQIPPARQSLYSGFP